MPKSTRSVSQNVTPRYLKLNGETYKPLDPKIIKLAEFIDRSIRSQNVTIGVAMSAIGIVLGRKVMDVQNLEHMAHDVTMAMRVGFFLAQADRQKEGK